VLVDIASHVHDHGDKDKRDIISDIIAEAVEVEQKGWPWPWPGDDKPKPPPGDGSPDNKTKEEPVEVRMERLAAKVVHFERELMRAGADPEYLFNPHYAYNPYPAEKVDKHLPIIDVRSYLSTFNSQHFPVNITVTYPPYLKAVSKLVADTPDYVLSGYFATRLAFSYSSALGPKVSTKQATKRLGDTLKGIKKGTEENRQDTCLAAVDGVVGYIAGREYVREAFSAEAKEDGTNIINGTTRVPLRSDLADRQLLSMLSTTSYLTFPGWTRPPTRLLKRRPSRSFPRSAILSHPILPTPSRFKDGTPESQSRPTTTLEVSSTLFCLRSRGPGLD
jgi:endothelin-converting enzyme